MDPRLLVALENRMYGRVGHARRRTDDSLGNLVALNAALCVELHNAAQHQAVLVRPKAANVGREFLRQHGNGAIGKIHAGAAQARFKIKVRALAHVFGYIGDMHLEFVAAGVLDYQHCIIEIFRRLAVDGHNGESAKVPPRCNLLLIEMRQRARLGQHPVGKDPRQLVLADHHLHIDAEIIRIAQHLNHAPDRRPCRSRPAGDLHIHHQAFQVAALLAFTFWTGDCFGAENTMRRGCRAHRRNLRTWRNQDCLAHSVIKWDHVVPHSTVRSRVMKYPNNGPVVPLHHAHDASLAASVGFRRLKLHQHLVALHGSVNLVGGNEDILVHRHRGLPRIGPHKAEPIAMQVKPTGHQIVACAGGRPTRRFGNAPYLAVDFCELLTRGKPRKLLQQQTPLAAAAQTQFAHELFISRLASWRARNSRQQISISHSSRVGHGAAKAVP